MTPEKLIIKWSKKERDMICMYPNRNGRILSRVVFGALDWLDKDVQRYGGKDFRDYVEDAGYDYESMRITFTKKGTPPPCDQ